MLTKFNDSNDMNTIASDAIRSYIKDGYRIDTKESVIDREKDKDCTFKAVLRKNIDGINCKTIITLSDNGNDKNKHCTYHKVETVGDTKWSEETRTFSHSTSTDKTKLNSAVKNHILDNICRTSRMWWDHVDDDFIDYYYDSVRKIFKDFDLHGNWFKDEFNDRRKRPADDQKASTDNKSNTKSNTNKKDIKWKCKCSPAYKRLYDYIKLNSDSDKFKSKPASNEKAHINKVDPKDLEDNIYNSIINRNGNTEDTCKANTNTSSDKKKASIESLTDKDNQNQKDKYDDLEDSLIRLVRYIFGK